MEEEEVVFVVGMEKEGFVLVEFLVSIVVFNCSGGIISDSFEVGGNIRIVVGNIDSKVVLVVSDEVGVEEVVRSVGIVYSWVG